MHISESVTDHTRENGRWGKLEGYENKENEWSEEIEERGLWLS